MSDYFFRNFSETFLKKQTYSYLPLRFSVSMSLFNLQERIDIVLISIWICIILLIVFSYGQKILRWWQPYLVCYLKLMIMARLVNGQVVFMPFWWQNEFKINFIDFPVTWPCFLWHGIAFLQFCWKCKYRFCFFLTFWWEWPTLDYYYCYYHYYYCCCCCYYYYIIAITIVFNVTKLLWN